LWRVNPRFFEVCGMQPIHGRIWTADEARRETPVPVVVNREWTRQSGLREGTIVFVNANGVRVPAAIRGVVDQPTLDFYAARPSPTVFFPFERVAAWPVILLVRFTGEPESARRSIAGAVRAIDPEMGVQLRDYTAAIRGEWQGWSYLSGMLAVAGGIALGLVLAGMSAYLTQVFAERQHEVALRFAMGAQVGDIWFWSTRPVAAAIGSGLAFAAVAGAAIGLLPSGIAPSHAAVVAGAAVFAAGAVFALWALAAWLASRRAAAAPLSQNLREL
jgi:putative ABC transport system permease protein